MSGDNGHRMPFVIFAVLAVVTSLPPLLSGAGSGPVEHAVTLKTQDAKCHPDRQSGHVDLPEVETFAYQDGSGQGEPCIMATMGVQARVEFLNANDEDFTTYINIPANALVSGSCKSPPWLMLRWQGRNGSSRSLTITANSSKSSFQEDDIEKYSVEKVLLTMAIDEVTFPGILHAGDTLTASVENQKLFETPVTKSYKCKEVIVNLNTKEPVGTITVSFKDMQFQAYTNQSTFGQVVNCNSSDSTDYVAIGIGCFLGATIISALGSYAFCQWWRKKDQGS